MRAIGTSRSGKCRPQVVTAIGRELLGFIWAIGTHVEAHAARRAAASPRSAGADITDGTQHQWWSKGTRNGESSRTPMRRASGATRDPSPRQLPTDHDYAVSTREYQSDQPSRLPLRPPPIGLRRALDEDTNGRKIENTNNAGNLTGRSISEGGVTASGDKTRSRPPPRGPNLVRAPWY